MKWEEADAVTDRIFQGGGRPQIADVVRLWPVYLLFFLEAPKLCLIGHCMCVFDNQKSSTGFVSNSKHLWLSSLLARDLLLMGDYLDS